MTATHNLDGAGLAVFGEGAGPGSVRPQQSRKAIRIRMIFFSICSERDEKMHPLPDRRATLSRRGDRNVGACIAEC
jgi:hypothetical protein